MVNKQTDACIYYYKSSKVKGKIQKSKLNV